MHHPNIPDHLPGQVADSAELPADLVHYARSTLLQREWHNGFIFCLLATGRGGGCGQARNLSLHMEFAMRLLDTPFLIDLQRELRKKVSGKAAVHRQEHLTEVFAISTVSVTEFLEHFGRIDGLKLEGY